MNAAQHQVEPDPPVARLLNAALRHRLHLGMTLVARTRLAPVEALALTWDRVDSERLMLRLRDGDVPINERLAEMCYWHSCRQRLDARTGGFRWNPHGFVVADQWGQPFTLREADALTACFAVQAGLPPMPMAALRHPVMR